MKRQAGNEAQEAPPSAAEQRIVGDDALWACVRACNGALVASVASAPMPTKTIALEQQFPAAVAEQWSTHDLAKAADVSVATACRFLANKVQQADRECNKRVWKVTHHAGATFGDAASRGLRRMEMLNQIPDDRWTKEEDRIEKHLVGVLKPLIEWCKLRMDASPGDPAGDPPQLSDGL